MKLLWWRWFYFGHPVNRHLDKNSRDILFERWIEREPDLKQKPAKP